jgi:hypothetical protein
MTSLSDLDNMKIYSEINQENKNTGEGMGGYQQSDPYHSNQYTQSLGTERSMARDNFVNAKDSVHTGVIPRTGFNQRIYNQQNNHMDFQSNQETDKSKSFRSPLSGQLMSMNEFKHNNMEPFFGGSVRQNTLNNGNEARLERHTGASTIYKEKTELKGMFDMERDVAFVTGSPSFTSEDVKARFVPSQMRQNELPTTQIRVGPGLNQGYGWKPSGGLNQPNTRDFVIPKDTNDLRTLDNPKLSYKGRLIMGVKERQRAVIVPPKKNRVETYYKNSPDRYFKTTGAFTKERARSELYKKPTNKKNNLRPYIGAAAPNTFTKPYQVAAVKKSTKNNYKTSGWRNVDGKNQWSVNDEAIKERVGDYGKNAFEPKPQERDVTQQRTHQNNLKSIVQAIIMPVLDALRDTRKENFVGNNRPDGVMKAAMPAKMTVHDPNDIMRTTIKETTVDNDYIGIVSAAMPSKLTVYDPNDILRTTIKETTLDNSHIGFYGSATGANRQTVHDPNDVMRTTIKETTIENASPYNNLSAPKALTVYDPNDIMRTTIKETTIDNDHLGHISGVEKRNEGYIIANVNPKNTQKQFLSDYYYQGHADGQTGSGKGRGYLVNNVEAKTTQKQFLSNYEYSGHAGHAVAKPKSYADSYNAHITAKKDIIAMGRKPTDSNVKLAAGVDMINHYNKKIEGDIINVREPYEDKLYSIPPQQNQCGLTTTKDKLSEDVQRERLNPDNLKAFHQNPYTQPLNSVFPY